MQQLQASLLLLIITAESLLALPSSSCGGHLNLSQEPTGHLGLGPGQEQAHRPSSGLAVCTQTLEIPAGHRALLKLVRLEGGSSVTLVCGGDGGERALAVGDTAELHGCDRNTATLTWTGPGRSSDALQLFYYVQKDESSYTENYPVPDIATPPDPAATGDPLSESFLGASGNSSRNPGPTRPTAPAPTDGDASSFPGEEPNNGPDASGPDIPGRLDFSSTQHSPSALSTQNAEFQTASSAGTNARAEMYPNSPTLGYEKKGLAVSSIGPLLEFDSNTLATERHFDSTENVEFRSTDIVGSLRTQNTERIEDATAQRDDLRTAGSLSELGEHLSTTESSGIPSVTTKIEATHSDFYHLALSAESVSTQGSSMATSESFEVSAGSKVLPRESVTTESVLGRRSSSPGTPSPSLVPNSDTATPERAAFRTSTSLYLASADSTFGERVKEGAKTSQRSGVALSTTSSYPSDRATGEERSSPSSREGRTTHSGGGSAEGSSTASPCTISPQETPNLATIKTEMLPKTEPPRLTTHSSRSLTASTRLHVSRVPDRTQSSERRSLSTATVTAQKGASTVSQRTTSRTLPTVDSVPTSTTPYLSAFPFESSTVGQKPQYYVVPDEPVIIKEESFELLLQITVEDSTSAWTEGLEEDMALWLEPHLQKAPGFKKLLRVWSSGRALQSLVQFHTQGALQWLPHRGASLLERTGLEQAIREGHRVHTATVTNVSLTGLREACGWLLRCPSGFACAFDSRTSNYSCASVCRSDYCQHHGLCTHHPGQRPLCRCVAGQDFWFMGQRCEVLMTRARLALSCAGVLLLALAAVGVLACAAVRRYRALLIQAKVDQTRSSYRRFNHFDELSGRSWLRSWAGSADSVDDPAFSRSDQILHLRALERPCCYHDDSLSPPSTCPSPGVRIRTVYPHSSQYAWRGSELSVGDGVLDSGKASDLSVCSWPREPIQWSPFPLLQQLALQRPPAVRVTRTRSCCDGLELVDMNKSWTA